MSSTERSERPSSLQFRFPEDLKPVTKEGMEEFRRSEAHVDAVLNYYEQIENLFPEDRKQYEKYRFSIHLPLPLSLGER